MASNTQRAAEVYALRRDDAAGSGRKRLLAATV
jgi:hypothetical protein